ncbi:salicylate esterase [Marinobacterium zhoushanense]|uniref:Salicylate esterase n=1 Tax=Marinobacterium zhoushanense TaxID=1679163 RepID=A0ABQ1K078_9GAMM|nr:alpha/beta hydrolase [Marinobacterium zhoushanense]GGB79563.1 salicylate esterase [Marinobacterium zhoushanense]
MTAHYVLVHGACHTGAEMEATAAHIREAGYSTHCPTLAGNRPEDDRRAVGLEDAVRSLIDYIEAEDLRDVRLAGHSYGGMVIAQVVDRIPERISRVIFCNAFVPLDGEALVDLVPPHYAALFAALAAENNQSVTFPFPVFREAFMNDATLAFAQECYQKLNLQPYRTFTDPAHLQTPLAESAVGKSYVNCQQDTALPHSLPWHPRLSERLGLFRLVECPGSHELLFTDPKRFAQAILEAGRD